MWTKGPGADSGGQPLYTTEHHVVLYRPESVTSCGKLHARFLGAVLSLVAMLRQRFPDQLGPSDLDDGVLRSEEATFSHDH